MHNRGFEGCGRLCKHNNQHKNLSLNSFQKFYTTISLHAFQMSFNKTYTLCLNLILNILWTRTLFNFTFSYGIFYLIFSSVLGSNSSESREMFIHVYLRNKRTHKMVLIFIMCKMCHKLYSILYIDNIFCIE